MIAKIFYMNDESKRVTVKIIDRRFDPVTSMGELISSLMPAEGKAYELDIPDEAILFVKKWQDMVLISYVYFPAHVRPDEDLLCWGSL